MSRNESLKMQIKIFLLSLCVFFSPLPLKLEWNNNNGNTTIIEQNETPLMQAMINDADEKYFSTFIIFCTNFLIILIRMRQIFE